MPPIPVVGHGYDLDRDFYVLHLSSAMDNRPNLNEYTVSIEFTSVLSDELMGFYRWAAVKQYF